MMQTLLIFVAALAATAARAEDAPAPVAPQAPLDIRSAPARAPRAKPPAVDTKSSTSPPAKGAEGPDKPAAAQSPAGKVSTAQAAVAPPNMRPEILRDGPLPETPAPIADAEPIARPPAPPLDPRPVAALATAAAAPPLAASYCRVVQDQAQEARAAYQAHKLAEMEARLIEQIERLERRQEEYRLWFQKQEDARRAAEDNVAAILARMRPDAAAAQLAVMEESAASALLAKMTARNASAVLNEMPAAKAARLAAAMTPAPPMRGAQK